MQIKRVGIGDMFGWIGKTFSLVFAHPGALMGASFLMLVVVFLMSLPSFAMMGPMMTMTPGETPDLAQMLPRIGMVYAIMIVLNLVLMPPMIIGWLRMVRDLDQGRDAGATAIFRPYSDMTAWLASIRLCLLSFLVVLVLVALLAALFWDAGTTFFAQAAQFEAARAAGLEAPAMGFPGGLILGYILLILLMCFVQLGSFLGFTELALRGGGALSALLGGFRAVFKNLLGLLLFFFVLFLIAVVVAVVLALLIGLVLVVLAAISPVLMTVGAFLVYVPVLLVTYPLMHASAYVAWKDMLGSDAGDGADPAGQVSA